MQPSLFDAPVDDRPPDQAARDAAVDPAEHVVLEASAGTGKTRVLVDRYVRLIEQGVDPRHILAMTFTRKAAAEMRDRVLETLRRRAAASPAAGRRWEALRARIADIQVSTIDAFCYGLLREFPIEADVDPAFEIADETEMARFTAEALDLSLRAVRGLVSADEHVRLLLARVKAPVLRDALGGLVDRRHAARAAVAAVARRVRRRTAAEAAAAFVERLAGVVAAAPAPLIDDGPSGAPEWTRLSADLASLAAFPATDPRRVHELQRRLERYFLTRDGRPRQRIERAFASRFPSAAAKTRHTAAVAATAPAVLDALAGLEADVNGLLTLGLERVLAIAATTYERLLDEHALVDFAGMLDRAVALLSRQEEFARSRLKLQARFHHLLVDEFQDTSRLQWRLVELLIAAWGEGEGVADAPTSVFVVGDRKQSIYRFRQAEVTLFDEAARRIGGLRPGRTVRRAITHSFRAVPELLGFVNALAGAIEGGADLAERFTYGDADRFPVGALEAGARRDGEPVLGLVAEPSLEAQAGAVAAEIARLVGRATVGVRRGAPRPAAPDDVAILFRARAGHQYFERALEAHGLRPYVYKGLGFFDAPEVQDVQALVRYLARPESDLRAAELLRSRLVRLSDPALVALAPRFADALGAPAFDSSAAGLAPIDRQLLECARAGVRRWLALADRARPGEVIDAALDESAFAFELAGRRLDQARENLKKLQALVRRVESRGYATLGRLAAYFETLRAGEESNAIVEASGCVNLMTIHAAKGLEFPIVFVVNLQMPGRGRPPGFSVIDRGPDGEPDVAFSSSPATRLEDAREMEELRRLLYVAATRARDRLYLAGEVDDKGRLKRPARSLAALLPQDLADLFQAARAPGVAEVEWARPGRFAFRVCRPDPARPAEAADPAGPPADTDRGALAAAGPAVVAATAIAASEATRPQSAAGGTGDRLVGTIVHRLFQLDLAPAAGRAAVEASARAVARAEDLVDTADPGDVLREAAAVYAALRSRPDVAALLASGERRYEVPFSWFPADRPDRTVRGVLDCLVVPASGPVTVVEIKTGPPRPEHAAQTAIYAMATAAAFPGRRVRVARVYPGDLVFEDHGPPG